MTDYLILVTEIISRDTTYRIKANTPQEAVDKLCSGECSPAMVDSDFNGGDIADIHKVTNEATDQEEAFVNPFDEDVEEGTIVCPQPQ